MEIFLLESLFFKAYFSYLDGDLPSTKMYLSFLREECRSRPGKHPLNPYYVTEFRKVVQAAKSGKIPQLSWLSEPVPEVSKSNKTDLKQPALVESIHKSASANLKDMLGARDSFQLYNIEHPCPPYGAVDMLYQDDVTCFPLEVKKDRGEHDLIGQIMKYELYCKKQLHLKFYYKVQPVTICAGYDRFTHRQLKQLGVITVRYSERGNKIKLDRV